MLLVMARADDQLSASLLAIAAEKNRTCAVAHGLSDVDLTVHIDERGQTRVKVAYENHSVSAIINRYVEPQTPADETSRFIARERYASWWATLALFAGPGVNRPTAVGLFPVGARRASDKGRRIRQFVHAAGRWFDPESGCVLDRPTLALLDVGSIPTTAFVSVGIDTSTGKINECEPLPTVCHLGRGLHPILSTVIDGLT
jgi:hypothetical protein